MAIIRLDCNLNGGDSVTPNNELFYRIYGDVDNYAAPIHTTGTALSDANVTVNNDNVIITGVDGTTNSSFKIAAVDGAGNEGILSDAYSAVIILFEDDFTGTSIDTTTNWTEYPNASTLDSITQNGVLELNRNAPVTEGVFNHFIRAKTFSRAYDAYSVMIFDMQVDMDNPACEVGFVAAGLESNNQAEGMQITNTWTDANLVRWKLKDGTTQTSGDFALSITTNQTYKLIMNNGTYDFYYWNSGWQLITSQTYTWNGTANVAPYVAVKGKTAYGAEGGLTTVDNLYVLDGDISTQYPI